ncbi:hypothetical protein JXA88_00880 [Candidatus Fermentibacteria bacterium]|nr:hypothetical protein [Candidatus Fermentibacteria bacterium]
MRPLISFCAGLLVLSVSAHAQYIVGPSVIAGGGARMTGGAYVVTGTTGQSSPVGISTGGAYQTHHGFWHAATGGGGLLPMVLNIVQLTPTTARLSWAAITGATLYDLYRTTTAFFNPSGSPWQTVASPTTQFDFTQGVGNETTNYFFRGIARNATQTSPASNTAGEFDFGANIPLAQRSGSGETLEGER